MSYRLVVVVGVCSLVVPGDARAQDPGSPFDAPSADTETEARALFANGQRMYDEGRYEQAIVAFLRAYELSQRPALLYNLANAYERLGNLEQAVESLNAYRVFAPVADQDVLLARVQALERRLAERPATPVPAPSGVGNPTPMPLPEPAKPVRRSPAPWIVTGIGLAAAVGGSAVAAGTYGSSRGYLEEGDREAWERLRPVNNAMIGVGIGGVAVGAAGLVWGIVR
jgi:tetratricopeptide (TPR) repeat protein